MHVIIGSATAIVQSHCEIAGSTHLSFGQVHLTRRASLPPHTKSLNWNAAASGRRGKWVVASLLESSPPSTGCHVLR